MPDNIVRAILIAHVQPKDNLEDEFNRWYDDIHIPQVVDRLAGVVSGKRYRYAEEQLVDASGAPPTRYLTMYEIETHDLADTVDRLGAALTDGTLDMSESLDTENQPPILHFYGSVSS